MRLATAREYLDSLLVTTFPGLDTMSLTNSRIWRGRRTVVAAAAVLSATGFVRPARAQRGGGGDPSLLTVERIYDPESSPSAASDPRAGSTTAPTRRSTRAPGGRGSNLVRVDAATGKATVIVPATRLVPSGASDPIEIEDYAWSPDHSKLLVYTNTARVWRQNTRGDYWVLDLSQRTAVSESSAVRTPSRRRSCSPNSRPTARASRYVREHNLYVESTRRRPHHAAHDDGSVTTINGTFDWVYEEELDDRDGFRWSPDGKHDRLLAARRQRRARFPADRQHRLALLVRQARAVSEGRHDEFRRAHRGRERRRRTDDMARRFPATRATTTSRAWIGTATNDVLGPAAQSPADAEHVLRRERLDGRAEAAVRRPRQRVDRRLFRRDRPARVDWLADNSGFVFLSERDGWRACVPGLQDGAMRLITPGEFDVMKIEYVDTEGWLALLRRLAGERDADVSLAREARRVRPPRTVDAARRRAACTRYDIAPGAHWAIHTYSRSARRR